MKKLNKQTEMILVGFCLHEHLQFPMVKEIFLQQSPVDQKNQLRDMKRTIMLSYPNNKAYAQFIKSASNDTKRSSLKSSRTNGKN